jgi:hypothetical protein
MTPERRIENFSTQDVLRAEGELLRCLVVLLMEKRLISDSEVMLLAKFAKDRLEKCADPEGGKRASAYVDMFLRSIQPDDAEPTQGRQ